ncbi:MAG: preprotein translocase subunit YajC [Proteobacteria bacterium]|nr:preprotein translocase subunit YajC [Pseudomonadota bacterium]
MGTIGSLLIMLLLFAIFYFMIILPQKKAMQAHEKEISEIVAGDRVETVSRVYGKVVSVIDDDFVINIAEGSGELNIRIHKQGIARVVK